MNQLPDGVIDPAELRMRAEYRFNSYFIVLPRGVTVRDLYGPEVWSAVVEWQKTTAVKLRVWDILRIRAHDGSFDASFTIAALRKDGSPALQPWPRMRTTDEPATALTPVIPPMPRSKADAYGVLGLHPDADAELIEKTASALRKSWHPDHASGPADQALREERSKAINAALEILSGKRKAAA